MSHRAVIAHDRHARIAIDQERRLPAHPQRGPRSNHAVIAKDEHAGSAYTRSVYR
jgi:hypothetical protein